MSTGLLGKHASRVGGDDGDGDGDGDGNGDGVADARARYMSRLRHDLSHGRCLIRRDVPR
jgi:hypothetical protein